MTSTKVPTLPPIKGDPRRTEHIPFDFATFRPDPTSTLESMWGLIAMFGGMAGLMLQMKAAAWFAVFACLVSFVSSRKSDTEPKQLSTSFSFAIMSVVMIYSRALQAEAMAARAGTPQ